VRCARCHIRQLGAALLQAGANSGQHMIAADFQSDNVPAPSAALRPYPWW
jgi:hypothetical protein